MLRTAPPPLVHRFAAPGPKRILALDGGGVRGIVSLCFLAEIEATLRRALDKPELVLSDYFDLIGGTSVGSMIATLLAMGKPVAHIRERFETWAPQIFEKKAGGIFSHMFDARRLRGFVQQEIFDTPLGSPDLKTGLCIVTKRIDTGSVWAVVNNPFDPFYLGCSSTATAPARRGNADYKLVDLIRASTAAPRYFTAEDIGIFEGDPDEVDGLTGTFVDGGVSPHNNPALLLFMMAGMTGYNFGGGALHPRGQRKAWKVGADNLLITSVGTGCHDHCASRSMMAGLDAAYALEGMISDGQQLALKLLQWMSVPARNWHIDRVCGDLSHDLLGDGAGLKQPLLSFQRYDLVLENSWLGQQKLITSELGADALDAVRDFTNPESMAWLAGVATNAARAQVASDHFPAAFNRLGKF